MLFLKPSGFAEGVKFITNQHANQRILVLQYVFFFFFFIIMIDGILPDILGTANNVSL